ncbi:MAG: hypothetical protein AAGD25_01655 [Cyanobacteria bacterium P01_F01_bin.150]
MVQNSANKAAKLVGLAGTLVLFFSCGRASGPPSSVIAQSSRSDDSRGYAEAVVPNDPARQPFLIPPDLAVMTVSLSTTQSSFSASTQLLQEKADLLLTKVGEGDGCVARILDYRQPTQPAGKYFRWDGDQYTSQIDLALDIDFDGLSSVTNRIQRLNNCIQRIPQFVDKDTKKEEAILVVLSAAMPTIRDASVHRDELLQRRFAPLQSVVDAAQPPGLFKAEQTRCTSNGDVRIVERTLSGVELDVNFECVQLEEKETGTAEQ